MAKEGVYLYGVTAAAAALAQGATGIGGLPVYGVRCGEFAALVSRLAPEAVDFQSEALMAHEGVLIDAMHRGTVIPAAFGHLFSNEAELCDCLEGAAAEMQASLERLKGCVEAGLKAIWRKDAFLPDIQTAELAALMNRARQNSADQSLALAVGELVEHLVSQRREAYVAEICPGLVKAALEMRLGETLSTRMVFNASFLVPAEGFAAFEQTVERIADPYADRLDFQCSGPWPPHNFSRLHIKRKADG